MATPAPGVPAQQNSNATPNSNGGIPTPSHVKYPKILEKILRPAQTSLYQCWFNAPIDVTTWFKNGNKFNYEFNQELISFSCSEASLPGSSFMTNEITDDYHGITERHAYRRAYDDRVDFTFYIDHARSDGTSYNVLWFFEKWMQYIVGEEDAEGLNLRNFNYRVRFPSNYQTDELFVNKFERDFKGQYLQYRFMQAYPISINSIPVSYDSSQLLKCTVSFTYSRYTTKRISINLPFEPLFKGSSNSSNQEPRPSTPPGNPVPPITTGEGDIIPPPSNVA